MQVSIDDDIINVLEQNWFVLSDDDGYVVALLPSGFDDEGLTDEASRPPTVEEVFFKERAEFVVSAINSIPVESEE